MMNSWEGLSGKIASYIAERAKSKLENLEKAREHAANPEELAALEIKEEELRAKFEPASWLTDAARRASQLSFVTHPVKFVHSQAKGASSCYAMPGPQQPASFPEGSLISTASLANPAVDVEGNAAALDVARLLQLEHDGRTLLDCVRDRDSGPLRFFSNSKSQLAEWMEGLGQVLSQARPSSHSLAKQLYFPVKGGGYHLLAPLLSSSLAQAVHERIQEARFSEPAKEARHARKESKFHSLDTIDFPSMAIMVFGGTKPQNVSQLNNRRGGKVFLFSCAPPAWQEHRRPPMDAETIFSYRYFSKHASRHVWELRRFLELKQKDGSNLKIRERRAAMVDGILDLLLQYGAEVQASFAPGWSGSPQCKLRRAEQLWLDPKRDDPAFVEERERKEWQQAVADGFARWLNYKLEGRDATKSEDRTQALSVGDAEHGEWKSLLEARLRLLKNDLEDFA